MVIRGTPGSPRPQKGDMRVGYASGPKLVTTPVALTVSNPEIGAVLLQKTAPADGSIRNLACLASMVGEGKLRLVFEGAQETMSIEIPFHSGVTEYKQSLEVKRFEVVSLILASVTAVEGEASITSLGISYDLVTQQR